MLKRKKSCLFILFGVVLFLLAACSKASESVPSATPSNAATSSQASVSEPKNDEATVAGTQPHEPTVAPTTDGEQQPVRSFVELATGGTGSASYIAEIIAQCPALSSWYTLDVEIADGIITINDSQYVQSTTATMPDIVYEEGMLKDYPELADTFAKIKGSADLFVLEHDEYHLYASFVDDTLYFLEITGDCVYRLFSTTI